MKYLHNIELSTKELACIGHIIAQWGALEHEIFLQTIATFTKEETIPKEMNNIKFTGTLNLWHERVVLRSNNRSTLQKAYQNILKLKDFRDALAHGMWSWNTDNPEKITSRRIKKKEIIEVTFTADDLCDFGEAVAEANFTIRYPGGKRDFLKSMMAHGGFMGRGFAAMVSGSPVAKDLMPGLLTDDDSDKQP